MSTKLSKDLGPFALISLSIGAMIGGGIFVLPGLAAGIMGPSIWMAYLLAGLLVIPPALAKIELATAIPGAGGTYLFIERSIGPMAGTVAGLGVWMVLVFKGSFALMGVSYYLAHHVEVPILPVALGFLLFLAVINCLGAKKTARLQLVIVSICLATLAVLIAGGLGRHSMSVAPSLPMGTGGLLAATGFVFISYAGVTSIASVSEEVKNPARDLPLAILASLFIMMTLYSLVALALMAAVDWHDLIADKSPMAALGQAIFGRPGLLVISVVAVGALVSMANSGLMAASRYPLAMGRDGLMPSFLQRAHPRFGTPVGAILLTGVVMAVIILTIDVTRVAKLASTFQILIFSAECLCVILFRESKAGWYRPRFKSPLYPWLPAFGIVSGLALIALLGWLAIGSTLVVILVGLVWYQVYGKRRTRRRGVIQQLGRREDLLPGKGLATRRIERLSVTDEELPGAEIVVPLLGREISPEALVEAAAALADPGDRMEVLQLKEVPPQTVLSDVLAAEERHFRALERRIRLLGDHLEIDVRFDTIVTRDVRKKLHHYASQSNARWVVMEWVPDQWQGFFVRNPLSWWMTHLPCNLALFKDAGNRHFRRIAVRAEPGPHDGLVLSTADRLAGRFEARTVFVDSLPEDAPEWKLEATVDYHEQLSQLCRGEPESRVLRTEDPDEALLDLLVDFDLLVLGARGEGESQSVWGRREGRLFEEAPCSVLELKTPRKEAHQALLATLDDGGGNVLVGVLDAATLCPRLEVAGKSLLFGRIAEIFAAAHPEIGSTEIVERAFWKREEMQNTAIGDGIAIPHATIATADRTSFGAFTTVEPIDYLSPGSSGVDLFFATIGPPSDRNTHLQLISSLSRLLLQTGLATDLRAAEDPGAVARAFEEAQRVCGNAG